MHAILNTIRVKPEHLAEFIAHLREHAANSRREAGCLRFDVLQDAGDPHTVCLYEVFRTEADLHVHRSQPYYQRWMALSQDWRDHAHGARRVLRTLSPPDDEWDVRS